MNRVVRLVLALLIATASPALSQQPSRWSFRAFNYPTHYVRHQGFLLGIAQITDAQARDDATWLLRTGLTGTCLTFEAVNFPGHYLRHQGFRVKLAPQDGTDTFRQDATWCLERGLAGDGASFRSANYPDRFLRHRGFELWLDVNDGTPQFLQDATFIRVEPVRF